MLPNRAPPAQHSSVTAFPPAPKRPLPTLNSTPYSTGTLPDLSFSLSALDTHPRPRDRVIAVVGETERTGGGHVRGPSAETFGHQTGRDRCRWGSLDSWCVVLHWWISQDPAFVGWRRRAVRPLRSTLPADGRKFRGMARDGEGMTDSNFSLVIFPISVPGRFDLPDSTVGKRVPNACLPPSRTRSDSLLQVSL